MKHNAKVVSGKKLTQAMKAEINQQLEQEPDETFAAEEVDDQTCILEGCGEKRQQGIYGPTGKP